MVTPGLAALPAESDRGTRDGAAIVQDVHRALPAQNAVHTMQAQLPIRLRKLLTTDRIEILQRLQSG